jgi:hypothetical protein
MKRFPASLALVLALLGAALAARPAFAEAPEPAFYLHVSVGAGIPYLTNLDNELERQGNKPLRTGYSLGISLGRVFAERKWSLEAHFAATFFPNFDYTSPYDSFPGKLKHYAYMAVLERHFRPEGKLVKPVLGVGIGAGQVSLVTGGGSFFATEALITGRIDSSIRPTIDLSFECSYYAGLQSKEFTGPFLENVDTDNVLDSDGNTLKDTFRSLDFRIGFTFWLKQMGTGSE